MERKRSFKRRRYRKPFAEKCKDYMRTFAAFMFSNVGIIGLVVGYTIAGAFIFIAIEGHTEQQIKINIQRRRNQTAERIWNLTYSLNILYKESWRTNVSRELLEYQNEIVEATRNGYDGSDNVNDTKQWSFAGGFLYSLTVITTIGYGNVLPRTPWGKVTSIIYAIIGMPLFLLYLSNIGDIMARSFKWIYAKCCLCRCCPGVAKRREERRRRRAVQMSTDYVDRRASRTGSELSQVDKRNVQSEEFRMNSLRGDSDDEDEDDSDAGSDATDLTFDSQTVTVPLTICLAIMVGYVCGGAILFSRYEDWNFLDGSYFCFISLSTIGFGDIVPGDKIYSGKGYELSFIFCSMYLMLGMALIAMCFNLMQEFRYELGGKVIDRIRNPGLTTKMQAYVSYVSYNAAESWRLQKAGWSPLQESEILDANGNFTVRIPLRMILGFAEDFRKILTNIKQELVLIRSNSDDSAYTNTNTQESIQVACLLENSAYSGDRCQAPETAPPLQRNVSMEVNFRSRELHEFPALRETDTHTRTIKTTKQLEKPRFVLVGFQTEDYRRKYRSLFNDSGLTNIKLHLGSAMYPNDNFNLDFGNNRFPLLYEMYAAFQQA